MQLSYPHKLPNNFLFLSMQLYGSIDKQMKVSQSAQSKTLLALHDKGVEDLKKKQDEYLREERKVLTKQTSDKQELDR